MSSNGRPLHRLVDTLARRLAAAGSMDVRSIETHISIVLLAGDTAYKFKKPLSLRFLDYGALQARRAACEEELRLNRRHARSLYHGVSRITGSRDAPEIDGSGRVIEYAVRMRRMDEGALLSQHALDGRLRGTDIDRLAACVAAWQDASPAVAAATPFGSSAARARAAESVVEAVLAKRAIARSMRLAWLAAWMHAQARALELLWDRRKADGMVRDGHGDLHLANLAWVDDDIVPFDAIEFDPALRCIDIVDEAAFVVMDLLAHGCDALAWRFLNGWLDRTGDHTGLPLWRQALVQRALVRALTRLMLPPGGPRVEPTAQTYLALAQRVAHHMPPPRMILMHGLPGSGKSTVALALAERHGAIRLRSDVERRRVLGLAPHASTSIAVDPYGTDASRRTYDRLARLAGQALGAGWPVIVDASFLTRGQRSGFAALAQQLKVGHAVLDCRAPPELLRQRVRARLDRGDDPSEADETVLAGTVERLEAVAPDEGLCVTVDTTQPLDLAVLDALWPVGDGPGRQEPRAARTASRATDCA